MEYKQNKCKKCGNTYISDAEALDPRCPHCAEKRTGILMDDPVWDDLLIRENLIYGKYSSKSRDIEVSPKNPIGKKEWITAIVFTPLYLVAMVLIILYKGYYSPVLHLVILLVALLPMVALLRKIQEYDKRKRELMEANEEYDRLTEEISEIQSQKMNYLEQKKKEMAANAPAAVVTPIKAASGAGTEHDYSTANEEHLQKMKDTRFPQESQKAPK